MRASAISQRATCTFCWLPPESVPTRVSIDGGLDVEPAHEVLGPALAGADIEKAAMR